MEMPLLTTQPHVDSVPFLLIREAETPEIARSVDARRPPARANVAVEDLPSVIIEVREEDRPRSTPPPLPSPVTMPAMLVPLAAIQPQPPFVIEQPRAARGWKRTMGVALLSFVAALAVSGGAFAWKTHTVPPLRTVLAFTR
jgi:hypothetical protein